MNTSDFYNDSKYCHECRTYVPYLQSLEHSYCAQCGGRVRLFSEADWSQFHNQYKEQRSKGGRPKKDRKEIA